MLEHDAGGIIRKQVWKIQRARGALISGMTGRYQHDVKQTALSRTTLAGQACHVLMMHRTTRIVLIQNKKSIQLCAAQVLCDFNSPSGETDRGWATGINQATHPGGPNKLRKDASQSGMARQPQD